MKLKNMLIVVKDIEKSKQFYKELFGLQMLNDFGDNVIMSDGLVLHERQAWQQAINKEPMYGSNNIALYFEDNDIDAFYSKLQNSKTEIKFVTKLSEKPTGQKVIRIYDPDAHIIEISEPLEQAIKRNDTSVNTNHVTVNFQSSIKITDNGKNYYFDPLRIDQKVGNADFIFITHEHNDHYSMDDIKKVVNPDTKFVVPATMIELMVRQGMDKSRLTSVFPGESIDMNGIKIEGVAAYNNLLPFHSKKSGWLGYVVKIGGTRYYIAGDTDVTSESKKVVCDYAFVPVGGKSTMNAKEAAKLVNEIKPKVAIPIHYGPLAGKSTDGQTFKELVDRSIQVELKLR